MSNRGHKQISERRPGAMSALAIMVLLLIAVWAVPAAQAQSSSTMTPLYDFQGGTDGDYPVSGLVADPAGNLYGTASNDAASGTGGAFGVVFEVNPSSDTESALYTFCPNGLPCLDGSTPDAALVMDSAGNLYGTTQYGGANNDGTVFELSPQPSGGCPANSNQGNGWCETVLYSFTGGADGTAPIAALIMDSAGNLYSTTSSGATNSCGSVFELSPASGGAWTETTLYDFTGGSTDGCTPKSAVTLDSNGNLYGATYSGGNATNYGTVYELNPQPSGGCPAGSNQGNGWCETVLHTFTGGKTDGYHSTSDLTFYQGNLYGTTQSGGNSTLNAGTVFELSPNSNGTWTETLLHSFARNPDGMTPEQGVVFDSRGNLYGAASQGGNYVNHVSSWGTVYEISATGIFAKLYQFGGQTDGAYPLGKLLIDANGNLFGTSEQTGPGCTSLPGQCVGYGAVWKLTPPPTVVNLTSSQSPSTYGQSVTFTATLPAVNGVTPTGTVTFMDGTAALGTATLNSGSASYTTSTLAVGSHSMTAAYSGDANFPGSTSGILGQVVNQIPQTITFTMVPPSRAVYGTSFTVAATGGGSGNPVVFSTNGPNGAPYLGCNSSGSSFTMTSGTNTCYVLANQAGNTDYAAAPQVSIAVTAVLAPTATGLVSSLNPSNYGQAVSFTATVTAGATGTVQFFADGGLFDTENVPVSGVVNSASINTLTAGSHTITAVYSGDTNYATSTGATVQTVNTAGPNTVSVTSSQNPSSFGQSVTLTATITGANGLVKRRNVRVAPQDVTGTVTWSSNTGCGTTPVTPGNAGTAACTVPNSVVSSLAVGSYTITATYSGDSNHNGGDSGTITQQVVASASTTTVTPAPSSPNPSVYGQAVNFTATVVPAVQGAGTPTGTVQFLADGTLFDTESLSGSGVVTSASINTLTVASHTITAVYSGDTNFASSTGTVSQVVNPANASMTIASSLNPSVYGQAVTFTATMTADNGLVRRRIGARPQDVTGTVTWSANTGCGQTLVNYVAGTGTGTATCTVSTLPVGTADIVGATYSGDINHNGSTGSISQEVDPAGAGVSVTSDLSPSTYGGTVQFTATITGANGLFKLRNGARPQDVTGSVTWSGNTGCAQTPVTYMPGTGVATATCNTSALPGGTDTVTANYSGDSNHNPGSGTVTQVVNPVSQHITVTTYPPSSAAYGSSFTVVASASSGLPVSYGLISGSDCTVSGATYTMGKKAGNCTVTLSQAGNNDYVAISPITESTTRVVAPQKRTVSFTTAAPATAAYQSTFTVTAQSQSQNDTTLPTIAVVLPAKGIAACEIVPGGITTGTAVSANVQMTSGTGACSLTATWPLSEVYAAATAKTAAKATKLTPVITWNPAAITYGTPLGNDQLNAVATGYNGAAFTSGTYQYNPAAGRVLGAGSQTLSVKFTPSTMDAANYADVTDTVSLPVSQASTTTAIAGTAPNPSEVGKPVKVSVLVTTPGKATGSVTVSADTGETCTIKEPSATGTGNCMLTITHTGTRTLTAVYAGDSNTATSTSAGFTQTVN